MKIKSIYVRNWQGVQEREVNVNSNHVLFLGPNRAGKTRMANAIAWILLGESYYGDSPQGSNFEIKKLDKNNEPEHGVEHEVKLKIQINGSQKTLKKIYKEKWEKVRNETTETMTGHTTDHYLGLAKVNKGEYVDWIEENIGERDKLRLLLDPYSFNTKSITKWKERRRRLTELCENVTIDQVIQTESDLEKIESEIRENGVEKLKSHYKDRRDDIKEDAEEIPTRIDEKTRDLPDIDPEDVPESVLKSDIEDLKEKKKVWEGKKESGSDHQIVELENQLSKVQNKIQNKKNDLDQDLNKQIQQTQQEIADLQNQLSDLDQKKNNLESEKQKLENEKENRNNQIQILLQDYKETQAEIKEINNSDYYNTDICPTCETPLSEMPDKYSSQLVAELNAKKAEKLDSLQQKLDEIDQKGKYERKEIKRLESDIKSLSEDIDEIKSDIEQVKSDLKSKKSYLQGLTERRDSNKHYKDSNTLQDMQKEKSKIQTKIQKARNNDQQDQGKSEIDRKIENIQERIDKKQARIDQLEGYHKVQARIDELKQEEKEKKAEANKYDRLYELCKVFQKTEAELIEKRVEDKFEYCDFKLFRFYQNGGTKQTCKTMIDGVPWQGDLSTGTKIKAGVDIVKTLREFYNIDIPIIIDRAESWTDQIDFPGQVFKLITTDQVDNFQVKRK